MKKIIFLLSLVALAACGKKSPVNESRISGTVLNSPTEYILLSQMRDVDTIMLNEDGSFSFVKQIEKAGNFYIQSNKKLVPLFLEPGRNIEISFDALDLDNTLVYEGDLASEGKYTQIIDKLNRESNRKSREMYLAEPDSFLILITADRQGKETLLKDFMAENPGLSDNFINREMMGYEFTYYLMLMNFEQAHKYYAKKEEVVLTDDWYSFMENIDLNNADYLDIPACLNVVSTIIDKKINETAALGDEAWGTAELLSAQSDWLTANITNQQVKEHFLYTYITAIVDYRGPAGIEKEIDIYNQMAVNENNKSVLADKVAEWAPLAPGNMAPAFTLPDINGNEVSLSDFAGKYVYIDFWATWCGPCKIEIPVLETLYEDYKDKNIVIMSISVDRDKQAWIDMVTRDKPQWLQLHDSINMNDNYLVKFIPTFVLIDREGKIIDVRAPRPSSGEQLTNLFDSLEGI